MVNILIAGDFCPSQRVVPLIERSDHRTIFRDLLPVVQQADYAIVNLEAPIADIDADRKTVKWGPHLCCTEKAAAVLKHAGFDCVTLANNHFRDYGDKGVENTLNALRCYRIDSVGGGMNLAEASQPLYKEVRSHKIAFINCCEHEFSIAAENEGGGNPLNPIRQYRAICEARKQADYVIVIVHGGPEHCALDRKSVV